MSETTIAQIMLPVPFEAAQSAIATILSDMDVEGGLHVPYAWIGGEQFVLADVGTRGILERSHEDAAGEMGARPIFGTTGRHTRGTRG